MFNHIHCAYCKQGDNLRNCWKQQKPQKYLNSLCTGTSYILFTSDKSTEFGICAVAEERSPKSIVLLDSCLTTYGAVLLVLIVLHFYAIINNAPLRHVRRRLNLRVHGSPSIGTESPPIKIPFEGTIRSASD